MSEQVIISVIKLFNNNSNISSEHTNAIKAVKEALYNTLNINSNALTQGFDNEIENLIKQANTLANETINISEDGWSDQQYTQVIKNISLFIYSELGMSEEFLIPEAIRNETENLVKKGLELVKKIASADPPGVLWVEKEGTVFNSDRHEAMLGCEESGIILFTVYPGYLVGSRVFDKAVVYTVPEIS
ncbi:hypothetical protein NIES2101_34050 [Calothrix sp. HK-06]|nr:hypothetical protein NIES2101_34050 [Calothrix sp. HK-06]